MSVGQHRIDALKAKLAVEKQQAEGVEQARLEQKRAENEEREREFDRWVGVYNKLDAAVARLNSELGELGVSAKLQKAGFTTVAPLEVTLNKKWVRGFTKAKFYQVDDEIRVAFEFRSPTGGSRSPHETTVCSKWQISEDHLFHTLASAVEEMP